MVIVDVRDASNDGLVFDCAYQYPGTEISGCDTEAVLDQLEALLSMDRLLMLFDNRRSAAARVRDRAVLA